MSKLTKLLASTALMTGLMIGTGFAAGPSPCGPSEYSYKLVTKINLPTKAGHGDWVAYDPETHDVYVSLVDGMAVVSTATNKVIHSYSAKEIPAPNTMTFDRNYIYETVAEGPKKKNEIVVINKHDWKIVDRVNTKGTSPDGTFIDRANHHLYVISDDENWIEVYTASAHPKFITKYPEVPKNTVAGPDVGVLFHGTIYATNDAYLESMNPNDGKIEKAVNYNLKLNKFGGTKGAIWDSENNTIWVGTTNHEILEIDPKTLQIIKPMPEVAGADEVAVDPGLGLVYAFEGGIPGFDVFSLKEQRYLTTVKTGAKKPTHSGTVDTANHDVYAYVGGHAQLWVYRPVKK